MSSDKAVSFRGECSQPPQPPHGLPHGPCLNFQSQHYASLWPYFCSHISFPDLQLENVPTFLR